MEYGYSGLQSHDAARAEQQLISIGQLIRAGRLTQAEWVALTAMAKRIHHSPILSLATLQHRITGANLAASSEGPRADGGMSTGHVVCPPPRCMRPSEGPL